MIGPGRWERRSSCDHRLPSEEKDGRRGGAVARHLGPASDAQLVACAGAWRVVPHPARSTQLRVGARHFRERASAEALLPNGLVDRCGEDGGDGTGGLRQGEGGVH